MKTAVANNGDMTTEVPDGTVLSNLMSAGSDTSTFVVADDSLQGIAEGAAGGGATAAEVKTALEEDGSKLDHLWEMTEDDGGTRRLTANAQELGPRVTSASGSVQGRLDENDLEAYQYAALGPFNLAATTPQTGDDHAFTVYSADDPSDGVFELTTGGGEISVGGDGDLVVTVSQDDTNTGTAGLWRYILRNTTTDTAVARGTLTIKEEPEVGS
jgi:hypothetical protein